jgi:hypothetical protein
MLKKINFINMLKKINFKKLISTMIISGLVIGAISYLIPYNSVTNSFLALYLYSIVKK